MALITGKLCVMCLDVTSHTVLPSGGINTGVVFDQMACTFDGTTGDRLIHLSNKAQSCIIVSGRL